MSSSFFTSIKAALVARKGLPGNSANLCIFLYIHNYKVHKENKLSHLDEYIFKDSSCCAIVLSSICSVIYVGVSSPKPSLFITDSGIKWMLAPESHKAFLNSTFVQGMLKFPGSYIFTSRLFRITALQVVRFITPSSANLLFLLKMSFRNLA